MLAAERRSFGRFFWGAVARRGQAAPPFWLAFSLGIFWSSSLFHLFLSSPLVLFLSLSLLPSDHSNFPTPVTSSHLISPVGVASAIWERPRLLSRATSVPQFFSELMRTLDDSGPGQDVIESWALGSPEQFLETLRQYRASVGRGCQRPARLRSVWAGPAEMSGKGGLSGDQRTRSVRGGVWG